MDYKLSELSDCVFGYLAANPDEAQSLTNIWNHVTGETGHRCSTLNQTNTKHKKLFLATCDTLDNNYQNIYKFYKNGVFYIMYSDRSPEVVHNEISNYYDINKNNTNDNFFTSFGPDIIIDYFFNSENNSTENEYTAYVKNYLSQCTVDDARKIFGTYKFSPDRPLFGSSLLDMAIQNNNMPLVAYLTKVKYESKVTKLKSDNLTLKKNNTVLMINNKNLEKENKKLKNEMKNISIMRTVPVAILVSVIVGLIGYILV